MREPDGNRGHPVPATYGIDPSETGALPTRRGRVQSEKKTGKGSEKFGVYFQLRMDYVNPPCKSNSLSGSLIGILLKHPAKGREGGIIIVDGYHRRDEELADAEAAEKNWQGLVPSCPRST